MDKLTKASHKLAEELYRQAGGPSAGPTSGPPPGSGDGGGEAPPQGDVVDAEYTVKGEKEQR